MGGAKGRIPRFNKEANFNFQDEYFSFQMTNAVFMLKLTIEEYFEITQTLIKDKFSSLNPTKPVYSFGTPVHEIVFISTGSKILNTELKPTAKKDQERVSFCLKMVCLGQGLVQVDPITF